jgi:hypothetical protein
MSAKDSKLYYGPTHTNLNVIVALDIRVGGNDPYNSDLLEVCAMPLNHSYRPHADFAPFYLRIKPTFPVDLKIAKLGGLRFEEEYLASPTDGINAAELFGIWWKNFRPNPEKKIEILTWDWSSKRKWIEAWLDGEYMEYISSNYRDLEPLLNFINDREDYHGGMAKYPVQKFTALMHYSGIEILDRNSLMSNCKAMSDAYRYLLHQR